MLVDMAEIKCKAQNSSYNLGHNWFIIFPTYRKFTYFYDKFLTEPASSPCSNSDARVPTQSGDAQQMKAPGDATSFPGSLILSSGRDPGCGWSRASQILGGKFNCNCERGGKGACL